MLMPNWHLIFHIPEIHLLHFPESHWLCLIWEENPAALRQLHISLGLSHPYCWGCLHSTVTAKGQAFAASSMNFSTITIESHQPSPTSLQDILYKATLISFPHSIHSASKYLLITHQYTSHCSGVVNSVDTHKIAHRVVNAMKKIKKGNAKRKHIS